MAFKYKGRDSKAVKKRSEQSGGSFDSFTSSTFPRYKMQDGANNIRILPWTWHDEEEKWGNNWGIEVWLHNGIGADRNSYLCPNKMKGKHCPLCEARLDFGDDEEKANALKPGKRVLAMVIDRDDEKVGPQVVSMPWTLERDIQALCLDDKTGEALQIDHPEEGYDVSFRKDGKGLKTKYIGIKIARSESPISDSEKEQDKWLDLIEEDPLPSLLVFFDADHMDSIYDGKRSRADDDDDDDKKGKRGERSSRKAKDEEDEKPSRRKASSKDEEDEDDKPKKRGRADADEENEKPSKRRAKDEDEDDPPFDKDEKKSSRKGKADEEDEDDDKPSRKRATRDKDEEDEDEKPSRTRETRKSRDADEEEDEKPKKRKPADDDDEDEKPSKSRGRASRDDDDSGSDRKRAGGKAKDEEEDEDDTSSRAKASVERLRKSSRARNDD